MSEETPVAEQQQTTSNSDDHPVENTDNTAGIITDVDTSSTIEQITTEEQTNTIEPTSEEPQQETTEETPIVEEQSTETNTVVQPPTIEEPKVEEQSTQQQTSSPTSETNFDNGDWLDGDSFATTDDQQQETLYNNDQPSSENNSVLEQTSTNQDIEVSDSNAVIQPTSTITTDEQESTHNNNEESNIVEEQSDKVIPKTSSQEDFGEYSEDTSDAIIIGESTQEQLSSQDVNNQIETPLEEPAQTNEVNPLESTDTIEHSYNFEELPQPVEATIEVPDEGFANTDDFGDFPTTNIETTNPIEESSTIMENTPQEEAIQEPASTEENFEPSEEPAHIGNQSVESTNPEEESTKPETLDTSEEPSTTVEPEKPAQEGFTASDEDFGAFSPVAEVETSQPNLVNEPISEPVQEFANDEDFGEFPTTTSAVETANQSNTDEASGGFVNDEDFGDFPSNTSAVVEPVSEAQPSTEIEPTIQEIDVKPTTQVTGFDNDDFGDFPEVAEPAIIHNSQGFADEDDFGDFPTEQPSVNHIETIEQTTTTSETEPKEDLKSANDDFGDFPTTEPETAQTTLEPISEPVQEFANDEDFGDFPTTEAEISQTTLVNDEPISEPVQEFANDEDFGEFPASTTVEVANQSNANETSGGFANDEDFGDFPTNTEIEISQSTLVNDEPISEPVQEFANDEDFGEFPTTSVETANPTSEETNGGFADDDDFGDFAPAVESTEANAEDDFGDFAEPTTEQPTATTNETNQNNANNDEDEFGDFNEPTQESTNKDEDEFGGFGEAKEEEEEPVAKPVEINYADILKDQKHVIDSILSIDQIKNEDEFSKVKQSVHNLVSVLIPTELAGSPEGSDITGESGNTLEKLFNMNSNHNADILSKMSVWQNSCVEKHFLLSLGMEKKKNKKLNKPLRKALHRRTASTTYATPISGDVPQKPKIDTPNVDQRMKIDEIGNISQRMLGARHRRVGSTVTDLHLSPRTIPLGEKVVSPTTATSPITPVSTNKFTSNVPTSPSLSAQHTDDLINSYTPSINTPSSSKPKNVELDDIAALVFGSGFASPTKETSKTELKVVTNTIKITTTSASPSGVTPQSATSQKATANSFDNDDWGKSDSWNPSISTKTDNVKPIKLDSPGFENDTKQSTSQQPKPSQSPVKKESVVAVSNDDFGDFPEPKQSTNEETGWSNNDSWDAPPQTTSPKASQSWAATDSWSTPEPVANKETSNDSWGEDNKWTEQSWEPSPPKVPETKSEEPIKKIESSSVVSASEDDFGDFPEPKDTTPKHQNDQEGFAKDDDFGDFPEPKDQQDPWENTQNNSWASNSDSWGTPQNDSWASQVDSFKPEATSWESSSNTNNNTASSTESLADQGFTNTDDFGDFPVVKEEFKPQADPWETQIPTIEQTNNIEPVKVQTPEVSNTGFVDTTPQDNNQGFGNDDDFGDFPEPQDHTVKHDDFGDFPEPQEHKQDSWAMQPVSSNDSWLSAIPTNVQTNVKPVQQLGGFDDWLSPATVSTPPAQSTGTPQSTSQQPISDDWLSGSISTTTTSQPSTIVPTSQPVADDWLSGSISTTVLPQSQPNSQSVASDDWLSGSISTPATQSWTAPVTSTVQTAEDDFGDFPEPKDQETNHQDNDDDFGDFPEPQDHVPKQNFSNDGFGAFQEPVVQNIIVPPVQPKPIGGFDDWLSTPTSQSAQSTGFSSQPASQPVIADDWLSGSISTTTATQPSTNNTGKPNDLFEFF